MKNLSFALFVLIFFAGCSQKVLINATKPAKIDRAANMKKVSVLKFENDTVSLASKIESALHKVQINGVQFFTLISRSNLDDILKEQRFQYSGLTNSKNSVEIGELLGAQALITGKINNSNVQKDYYYEKRYRCVDKKCQYTQEYRVQCTRAKYSLGANISMIDVQKGDVIYTNNYLQSTTSSVCMDQSYGLPEKNVVFDRLANIMVQNFLPNISPTSQSYYIELLDEPDISYTKEQEILFENALYYLKHNQINRGEELFSELLNSTNDSCFVAAYNLGIIKESKGEYLNAKELFLLSDRLSKQPNKVVIEATNRIEKRIDEQKRLQNQMGEQFD